MSKYFSFAIGIGTQNSKGDWLEVFYPQPEIHPANELINAAKSVGYEGGNQAIALDKSDLQVLLDELGDMGPTDTIKTLSSSDQPLVLTVLETDAELSSTPEAYLKLHLLSHRLVKPQNINLAGIFPLLPNVAWTSQGAIDPAELADKQLQLRARGKYLSVNSVDKFPKMTDYVVPSGVRIAHTARVRLGAYIGEGTTIMHEGFVNFNAGTDGTSMIEGRISAGVFVGKGSDLGGGCSTMGTLSGGGNIVISVGKECLLGANAGTGIPLGDRCTIESGLYITAGTKVIMLNNEGEAVDTIKAKDLAGESDLLFRRNSTTGAVECLTNRSTVELNEALHAHNWFNTSANRVFIDVF